MKEAIVEINKTKSCSLRRYTKLTKPFQTLQEKKRRIKSKKLEMKKERLQ